MTNHELISGQPSAVESLEPKRDLEHLSRSEFFDQLGRRLKSLLYPTGEEYLHSWQKRTLDVVGSVVLFPVAMPLMVGSAMAIKLEDGGPAFIALNVGGQNNEEFDLYKLRSMSLKDGENDQNSSDVLFHKKEDNSRVTRVGRFIRKWSIDELPQLLNIVREELSLVGNRPMFQERIEALGNVEKLKDLYPKWIQTLSIAKPGAAGLATSRGRALLDQTEQGLRRRLRYEIFYVTHASLGFDIMLLADTVKTVLSRRGAF